MADPLPQWSVADCLAQAEACDRIGNHERAQEWRDLAHQKEKRNAR